MTPEKQYDLVGYIEYVKSNTGFVTPVFVDSLGKYVVQVSEKVNQWPIWEELPKMYYQSVSKTSNIRQIIFTDSIIYGFKWNEHVFFGSGKIMSQYLLESVLPESGTDADLIYAFLTDWPLLEPLRDIITEENVWEKCIEYIRLSSKVLANIIRTHLIFESYQESTLILRAKNVYVKGVFENRYKDDLISFIKLRVTTFNIIIKTDLIEKILSPNLLFEIGYLIGRFGTHIAKTYINKYQDFETFVVSDFNQRAVEKAFSYVSKGSSGTFIIAGRAGTGKSHLLNSIANLISDTEKGVTVAFYTILDEFNIEGKIANTQLEQFEASASTNDVIIIDDLDNVSTQENLDRLLGAISRLNSLGKSIVVSSKEPLNKLPLDALKGTKEIAYLSMPSESDKVKLLKVKSKELNIALSNYEIERLSGFIELNSVSDVYKLLVRTNILRDIGRSLNEMQKSTVFDTLNSQLLRKSIDTHFWHSRNRWPHSWYFFDNDIYLDILSRFCMDLFATSKSRKPSNETSLYNATYIHSLNSLYHAYFSSEEFRILISDISSSLFNIKP